ncbi:MAG: hypothetical protein ACD_35C00047G0001 [uncultured bacterium]|nr:MAG: hypothetical protein ACD_35C00047G0001 [uncultured bacterium]
MRALITKKGVPVGAMKRTSLIKIHDIRYIFKVVIIRPVSFKRASHIFMINLPINFEYSGLGEEGVHTRGDQGCIDDAITLMNQHDLFIKVDFDPSVRFNP